MGEIFAVETRGIGKPDYSREVSSARERAGIALKYNESLKIFGIVFTDQIVHPSPFVFVKPPLAAGATAHIVDFSTGLAMPYTFPKGYISTLVQKDWTCNQDIEIWVYLEGNLAICPGMSPSGDNIYINPVYTYTSASIDPTGASEHLADFQIVNVGGGDLEGGFSFAFLLEAVGTPPLPTTKDCRCPFCGNIQRVPVGTTQIICNNCGKTYLVYDFSRIRLL